MCMCHVLYSLSCLNIAIGEIDNEVFDYSILPSKWLISTRIFFHRQRTILFTTVTVRTVEKICMCSRICPRDGSWCIQ